MSPAATETVFPAGITTASLAPGTPGAPQLQVAAEAQAPLAAAVQVAADAPGAGIEEEREWERGAQRPALHAAPFHSRRSFFARYIAASACASTVSALSRESATAIPMLTPMLVSAPKRSNGRVERFAQAIRDPAGVVDGVEVLAQDGELVAAERAIVSAGRTALRMRSAAWRSSSSPAACPKLSLTLLKRSRSMNSTAIRSLERRERSTACVEPVGEQHAVREARERVVERQLA